MSADTIPYAILNCIGIVDINDDELKVAFANGEVITFSEYSYFHIYNCDSNDEQTIMVTNIQRLITNMEQNLEQNSN